MSFICDGCMKPSGDNVRPHVVVTETRDREYHKDVVFRDEDGRKHTKQVLIGRGSEIVSEARICPPCKEEVESVE